MRADPGSGEGPRILVVLHLFYTELWPEFRRAFARLSALAPWDLVVTCPEKGLPEAVRRDVLAFRPDARILPLPDRGYDIAPFCEALRTTDPGKYDLVFKFHTKRDVRPGNYYGRRFAGAEWRRTAVEGLLGPKSLPRVLARFRDDPRCGLVVPARLLVRRDSDLAREQTRLQAEAWGLDAPGPGTPLAIGTMFAARMDALAFLRSPIFDSENFPPSGRDHFTPAHSLERIIADQVMRHGFRVVGLRSASLRSVLRAPADALCALFWPWSAKKIDRSHGTWLWKDGSLAHVPPDPAIRRRSSLLARFADLLPHLPGAVRLRLSNGAFDPAFYRAEAGLSGPFRHFPALHWCSVGRWKGLPPAPPDPAPAERDPSSWIRLSTPSRTLYLSPESRSVAPGLRLELLETMNQPSATAPAACEPPAAADASAFAVLETLRELTVFRMRSEGPTVEKRVLADFPRPFRLSPIPETPFLRGTYVWPELRDLRAAGRNAELLERTAGFLHEAFRILREDGGMLRPDSLDALPHNAIRTSDGLRFFDINRSLDGGVPPSLYVFLLVLRDFGDFFVRAGLPPMPLRRTHARLCRTMGVLPQFARSVWLGSRVLWLSRPAAMSPRARYLVPLRAALTAAFVLAASALEPRGPSAP